jgi:choline kinase
VSAPRPFAGVLAAGHGARFKAAGVRTPKALVEVGGRALIDRTLDAFAGAGFDAVTAVVNDEAAPLVRSHLALRAEAPACRIHVKTTASTLETFSTLLGLALEARAETFLLTTVDSVGAPGELDRFARAASSTSTPLVLGIAPAQENDDSPLRVELEESGLARLGRGPYATIGFYAGRTEEVARRARAALAQGVPSLRAFLTPASALSLVTGVLLGRTIDVDTPQDVAMAERAIASEAAPRRGVS